MLPPLMRLRRVLVAVALASVGAFVTTTAAAQEDSDGDDNKEKEAAVPKDFPHLLLDTARPTTPAPDEDAYRFFLHGEHQIRYQAMRSFPLVASASAIDRQPGLVEQSLGQNHFVHHWLRLTPRMQIRDTLELVAQLDLVTGLVVGERARDTSADQTPRDAYNGFANIQPRWLYAQYRLPFGIVRIGQQPNHWGMGILANDGDHPTVFGDYRYGAISERVLFATKPGGKDSDFFLAIAGDLVFRDNTARLSRGQQAFQGVLAAFYERNQNTLGVFTTLRHQENDKTSGSPIFSYTDDLDAAAIDVHGRIVTPIPGDPDGFLFGQAEAAYILGSTNFIRSADQAAENAKTQIRSYGGAAAVGFVHRSWSTGFWKQNDANAKATSLSYLGKANARGVPYGDIVAQLELGYASGDADPYDGTQRRFVFDPNHRIGLLLFDEIMRFQTARSATAATDPLLTNANRPTPGVDLLPSNGGVFGAQYINPTVIVRPRHWLDVKAGMVVAQSTSDVVDPYRVATGGSYVNYRGGNPKRKDLGVELDAGIEGRFPLQYGLKALVGAQAGVLFPGSALENADGVRLNTQWIVIHRLGLVF
jgi:hypothetical protein